MSMSERLRRASREGKPLTLSASAAPTPLFAEYLELTGDIPLASVPPLGPDDALLIIDMQADFVPMHPADNPDGGRFGVADGDMIVQPIVDLTRAFVRAGATVCASRDYHPCDHASFNTHGGPFPVHCVRGSEGSKFLPPIATALADGVRKLGNEKVYVCFKAMHEHIDSFGALPYANGGIGRITRSGTLTEDQCGPCETNPMGCAASPWTGSLVLKQSNLDHSINNNPAAIDMDAPPDVLSVLNDGVDRKLKNLQDALKGKKRIFVCGLALDFCVLDTCLNAKDCEELKGAQVHMVFDAARAAMIPGIGSFELFGSATWSMPGRILGTLP